MSVISTPDLSDEAPEVRALELQFYNFGAIKQFGGRAVTIKCHEDNSLVKQCGGDAGAGRVIVVEPLAARRQKALDMGFEVIDSTAGDAGATLREMTGGLGVDKFIEAAGVPITLTWALDRQP